MGKTKILMALAVFAVAAFLNVRAALPVSAIAQSYKVSSVTDGDTIRVKSGNGTVSVRLIGVDAPELSSKASTKKGCFATQAKGYLTRRLKGKTVTLKADILSGDKDKYGRLLRYVYLGKENINLSLVLGGFAREYKYFANDYTLRVNHTAAQKVAKTLKLGLWNTRICPVNK